MELRLPNEEKSEMHENGWNVRRIGNAREWTYAMERSEPTFMNDDVSIVHSIYGMLNSFQKR